MTHVQGDQISDHRDGDQDHLSIAVSEFCLLANHLQMPVAERVGIAGLTETQWNDLGAGGRDLREPEVRRCLRRLNYSLPLLRALITHRDGGQGPA